MFEIEGADKKVQAIEEFDLSRLSAEWIKNEIFVFCSTSN